MAHSSFIINYYLIDENNEYILDENGDKIIISTQSVDIDHDYQAIGGQASSRRRYRAVQSFDVKSTEDQTDWHLIINQQTFVGRYPTQAAAISVLYGIMYQHSGNENSFAFALEDMINRGGSTIDPVGDNLPFESFSGGEYSTGIRNFNTATWIADGVATARVNSVVTDRIQVTSGPIGGTLTNTTTDISDGVPSQEATTKLEYGYQYNSQVRVTDTVAPDPEFNTYQTSVTQFPALSANLSFQSGFPIVGQPLTATATLTNYDSRIPVKYQWTWKENPSGSNTTVKTETTTSSTSSYTPTSTFNYRVEVEILYALDDSATGVTDSETSGNAQQPFEWLQGPEILNLAQDQYYVFPVAGTDYEATPTPSFSYEWMKNGSAFGTDSASQVLDQEGTYTVDVTGQNTINGVPYSETILSRNSIVISPAGANVADIKLFLTNDPTGTVITNPVGGTVYYAYAYDASGVLLTDSGIEWVAPVSGGVVPGSTTPALWAADTEAVIPGGTAASTAKPIARWGNEMYQTTTGNSVEVFVVADHIEGIDYVAFTANNGAELQVSTPETLNFTDAFGEAETIVAYKASINLSSVALGDKVEVRARVRPNFGTERILQSELSGSDLIISGDTPARRQGQFGSFVARFEEKVVNHSSGDIMTLINGTTLTSTEQLVIQLSSGLAQWGDIGATANMISLNGAYRPIVVRGVDSDYSSIVTNSDTSNMTNGRTKDLSLRFEDLEFRSARLDLATNSNLSTANYVSFFRCNMNRQWDNITPLDNYTYTDPNGDTQFLGGGELTFPGNGELCLAQVRDDSGNFYTGTPLVPYSVSGASYGYYLMECIGDFQCNAATTLVRNYIHRDGIEDSTNNDCFLNLKVRGGGRGNYKNFKLINETLIWDNSTTSFPDNTTILVDIDASPDGLDTDGGVPSTIPVRDRWRCYKNNSGAAMTFDPTSAASVELWTDTSPHVDASQPSELKNGSGDYVAIDNSLFYGLDVDASCSMQPRISRNANWETNSMWKNWNIDPAYDTSGVTTGSTVGGIVHYSNGAQFASQLLSYVFQHKDHWVVDNVVYDFGTRDTSETSGSLLFNYNDSGNRGWGNVPPTKPFDSCIRDATWKNSAFKLIQIDANDWALNNGTSLGPDLSDFKDFVVDGTVVDTNDPAGRPTLSGNSWTIDASTLANSTMAVSSVPSSAAFGDWLNAANRSVQWSTIASGTGSFVNQVPITGLNKIELFDNEGLNKRGVQLSFDAEADKDAFIAQTGTLTLAVTVTEAGHANVGTTYTYSWDFPNANYSWAATVSMLKWQWRTAGTLAEDVPADGSDDLYGDNPTYLVSFA